MFKPGEKIRCINKKHNESSSLRIGDFYTVATGGIYTLTLNEPGVRDTNWPCDQ
jgi:hypothetical protein